MKRRTTTVVLVAALALLAAAVGGFARGIAAPEPRHRPGRTRPR